jgi:lipopolysaccharide export system protein LptA
MSARDAFPAKFARRWIAAALFFVLAAVAFRFIVRRPRAAGPVPDKAVPETRKVDLKEGIRHFEYKDGKAWADVRADRFFLGEDGLNHLEGSVEIVDYGQTDGRETRMFADRVAYDKDMVRFTISGRVRVRSGDLTFESEFLEYRKNLGLYRTDRGGLISSEKLTGSGRTFEYDERSDELRLSGGFLLELREARGSSKKADISGQSLVYTRSGKRGRVEGRARLTSDDGQGTSDILAFELTEDEGFFRRLTFEKGARCAFADGRDNSGSRTIEAVTIRVDFASGASRVAGVEAEGDCRLTLAAPAEPAGRVQAGHVQLAFARDGKIDNWTASGDAGMSLEEKTGGVHDFTGENISYSGRSGILSILAKEGQAAREESGESRIEASSISLETGSKTARATGGVRCLLKPSPDGAPAGFFSRSEALFVTCRTMTSFGRERRSHFEGDVRAWQNDGSIQAGGLEVLEETGEVRGRGGVTAVLMATRDPASGERRIEAGGDEMAFSPAGREISFQGKGIVRIPGARLSAATVAIGLVEGKKEIKGLRAAGGVVVSQGNYEGRGEEAQYDPATDTLVLTGNPVLVEKGKGASRGDKLTFRLGDGRILIENKGQGRSITVVKS